MLKRFILTEKEKALPLRKKLKAEGNLTGKVTHTQKHTHTHTRLWINHLNKLIQRLKTKIVKSTKIQ